MIGHLNFFRGNAMNTTKLSPMQIRLQIARRAAKLLKARRFITERYLHAAMDELLVSERSVTTLVYRGLDGSKAFRFCSN